MLQTTVAAVSCHENDSRSEKSDRTHIDDLLESTGFLSINQISAYSSLMEFWKIVNQDFAYLTPKNVLTPLIKGEQFPRDSRSKSKNHVRPVMSEQDSFPMRTAKITSAYQMNSEQQCKELKSKIWQRSLLKCLKRV